MVKVRVSYVAIVADATGRHEEVIEVGPGTSVKELIDEVMKRYPKLRELSKEIKITPVVNGLSADLSKELRDGDEVALLPPASGG